MWYHAQAFPETGPLVIMIDRIFKDVFYYLGLVFIVLIGFALGLRFLLRHAANVPNDPPSGVDSTHSADSTSQPAEESDADKVQDAFGDIFRSLETMFLAVLGEFEPEVS